MKEVEAQVGAVEWYSSRVERYRNYLIKLTYTTERYTRHQHNTKFTLVPCTYTPNTMLCSPDLF